MSLQAKMEHVADYPLPPRVDPCSDRLRVMVDNFVIADTLRGFRILENSRAPTYYIPFADISMAHVVPGTQDPRNCEWRGVARFWDLKVGSRQIPAGAWQYPTPKIRYAPVANCLGFYAAKVDACFVGEEEIRPEAGRESGGWIPSWVPGAPVGLRGIGHTRF